MSLTNKNGAPRDWVAIGGPRPAAAVRLICCPYAGAGAHIFRTWPKGLPPWIEVWALEPPGRGSRFREPAARSLDALVTSLAASLGPTLDKPYAIFGHSFGALLGFELARLLYRGQFRPPTRLIVSGRGAPSCPPRKPRIHHLPDPEFLIQIDEYNGWPAEVRNEPELVDLLLPIIRNDFSLIETHDWQPKPVLDCDVSAFYGVEDIDVPVGDVEAWRELTTASFAMSEFDGDHFFLRSCEAELLERIECDLRRAF